MTSHTPRTECGVAMQNPSSSRYVPALRFDWLTRYYDVAVATTTRERVFKRALIDQADVRPRHRVLDLAAGTGTLTIRIKQRHPFADVRGVDGDPAILKIAVAKGRRANVDVPFDQGLSYNLPYVSETFDRVVSSLFFHHLDWEDKCRTAQECLRVLKPGAELHVADWGRPTNLLLRAVFLLVQLLDGYRNTQDNASGRLIELFEQAGFCDVSQLQTFSTVLGTVALYRAVKPELGGPDG